MATASTGDSAKDHRVNQIIAAYFKSVEDGQTPDRQDLTGTPPGSGRGTGGFLRRSRSLPAGRGAAASDGAHRGR